MAAVWSEERKLTLWHEIEALVLEAWAELEIAPIEAATAVRRASVDVDTWRAREQETGHELAAFVDVLAEAAGSQGRWAHYGLTSSDVMDTALAVQLRDATDLLMGKASTLFETLKRRAIEHRNTVMVGRTHGVWAEPTTFGVKLAGWAFEIARAHERLNRARATVAVGKISGAVGTYANVPPSVEERVCAALGLAADPASTQVVSRDRHAEYLATLALIGASLERFATEIRHLQRSEAAEVREAFAERQKGSSAMPHKRNPILSENVTGLARLLRGYALAGFEDVALWGERDISHSSVERVALPDASYVLDFALTRMAAIVGELIVDSERMLANLAATRGLVFSEAVLLALVEEGLSRDQAYRLVQRNALQALDEGMHLGDALEADSDIPLDPKVIEAAFDPHRAVDNVGVIFERLEQVELG